MPRIAPAGTGPVPAENIMKAPACVALLVLAPPAGAQLLVSPDNVTARHAGTDVNGTSPPTGAGNLDVSFQPTAFSNANGHSASNPTLGNEVRRWSSYDTVFFFEFPTGQINTARVQGRAESLARVGSVSASNITATATSTTRLMFDVTQPVNYHFFGSISLTSVAGTGPGFGSAIAEILLSRNGAIFHGFTISTFMSDTIPFNFSGTLQPGSYLLTAQAGSSGTATGLNSLWSCNAAYDGRIDFTPVPAPASFGLIAAAAIAFRRRRTFVPHES